MNRRFVVAFLTASTHLLASCAMGTPIARIPANQMTPAELIRTLGPPARITFNKTLTWPRVTGHVQEYRYYTVDGCGNVANWSFFYQNQRWLTNSQPVTQTGLRLLNLDRARDRKLVESFEAFHPWLQ